jgi:hypothetical protein
VALIRIDVSVEHIVSICRLWYPGFDVWECFQAERIAWMVGDVGSPKIDTHIFRRARNIYITKSTLMAVK